jgi:ribosomal protein S12 methylthiotransferase accessory factor
LSKAFHGACFFSLPCGPDFQTVDLAVGIFEGDDARGMLSFAQLAHEAAVPSICVALAENEARIGPLTLLGRPGCARCALERMIAASDGQFSPQCPPTLQVSRVSGPLLVRQIRAILRQGFEESSLLDHVFIVDVQTRNITLHRVIPLSRCLICGGAEAFPKYGHTPFHLSPQDSPDVVLGALMGWVDQRTGIVNGVFLDSPDDDLGLPFVATAAPPRILNENWSLHRLPLGWGKGLTISGALLSAIGEAIERYAASLPDARRVVWRRPDELDGEYLDPRSLALYTPAQYKREDFPYVQFDPSFHHPWVLGRWLGSNSPVWIPAVFAFLSLSVRPEHFICQGTSNGLAAWTDFEEAALRATMELVERDAFLTAWFNACPGQPILLDATLDPLLRQVLEGIKALGAIVEVYTLPTSLCGTTVLCLALGDGDQYPGATIGLSTDLDPRSALRQAVLELGQTGPYLRRMMRSKVLPVPPSIPSVQELLQHAAFYFPRDRSATFDRLRSNETPIPLCDLDLTRSRSLKNCASELSQSGIRVALVDVTSADVATGPFQVVRAVSSDLQPLWYGYGLERLQQQRIRDLNLAPGLSVIHPIW